jgi:hypothetical protein
MQAVLLWLEEALQFPNANAYVRSIIDQPGAPHPSVRIVARVRAAAVAAHRGESREDIAGGARRATEEALFRYGLFLVVNESMERTGVVTWLRGYALASGVPEVREGHRAMRLAGSELADELDDALQEWRDAVTSVVASVRIEEEVRRRLESRYFDGRSILFADTASNRARLREQADALLLLVDALSPTGDASHPTVTRRINVPSELVEARAAGLTDDARLVAYEHLGERAKARSLLEARLRDA